MDKEVDLHCAACQDHFNELVEVRGSSQKGWFVCPRSGHPTHYGPWGYAVDERGVKYQYEDGEITEVNGVILRTARALYNSSRKAVSGQDILSSVVTL